MKNVKAFFYILIKSISSPAYYKDLLTTSFKLSRNYFIALTTLASLVIAIIGTINLTPILSETLENFSSQIKDSFPSDLVIKSTNNEWSINKEEPFIVSSPKPSETESEENTNTPKNLIVLDHNGTVEDIEKHDTLLLINGKNMIAKDAYSQLKTYPIQNLPEGELDHNKFTEIANNINNLARFIPYVLFVLVMVYSVFYFFVFRVISLLIVGLVLWISSKLLQLTLGYKEAFRIALHTMTIPLIIELVTIVTNTRVPVDLWFFISNILLGSIVLVYLYKNKSIESDK